MRSPFMASVHFLFRVLGASSRARVMALATPLAAVGLGVGGLPWDNAAAQEVEVSVEDLIGSAVSTSNKKYPEIEDAIKRFRNQDVQGAREYLELARKDNPKLPPTDVTLAKLFYAFRNPAAAHQLLEKAAVDHPEDPEAYLLVGDRAFAEGRTIEAEAVFERAASIVSNFSGNDKRRQNFDIRVLAGRSAVLERRQKWDDAIELLAQWVKTDPQSATAHQRLGVTMFHTGKPEDALAEFKKAREVDPKTVHPQIVLGQLLTQQNELDKARKAYEQAYKDESKNDMTARAYAEWLLRQDDLDKAQEVAAAMRKEAPESVTALLLDGVVSRMRGDMKAAEAAFMKVIEIEPGHVTATDFLALILADSEKVADQERALSFAKINAERFSNLSKPLVTYAWVLYRLNRPQEGGQVLQAAFKAQNLNADSGYLVAKILMQQNQKEQAVKVLEGVLQQAGEGLFIYRKDAEELLKQLKR